MLPQQAREHVLFTPARTVQLRAHGGPAYLPRRGPNGGLMGLGEPGVVSDPNWVYTVANTAPTTDVGRLLRSMSALNFYPAGTKQSLGIFMKTWGAANGITQASHGSKWDSAVLEALVAAGRQAYRRPVDRSSLPRNFRGVGGLLSGLGDGFTDVYSSIHGGIMDLIGGITGSNAQRDAQKNALLLADKQNEAAIAAAKARAEGWSKATPWLAIGGAAVVGTIVWAAVKK